MEKGYFVSRAVKHLLRWFICCRLHFRSGLSFVFQAPNSMKSVLQSFWLLTVAFGDLIVVILASVLPQMGVVSHAIYCSDYEIKQTISFLYETNVMPVLKLKVEKSIILTLKETLIQSLTDLGLGTLDSVPFALSRPFFAPRGWGELTRQETLTSPALSDFLLQCL